MNDDFSNSPFASYRLDEIKEKIQVYPIDIMLTGATGVGKSTTLNVLLGTKSAKVGHGADPETKGITPYKLNDYIRLWDTPGIGDSPEADKKFLERIGSLLRKPYKSKRYGSKGYLIDMVLVLLDGSTRDFGSIYELFSNALFKNIQSNRVLCVVNQVDVAIKGGNHWDNQKNEPDQILRKFLDEQTFSFRRRLKEELSEDFPEPLYYSASNGFNIKHLLDYIIDNIVWWQRDTIYNDDKSLPWGNSRSFDDFMNNENVSFILT